MNGISHVINYNLPEDPEDYVHRMVEPVEQVSQAHPLAWPVGDAFMLLDIEATLGQKPECKQPPSSYTE